MAERTRLVLAAELRAVDKASLTTGGVAEHLVAPGAGDNGLGMAEDRNDVQAALALDVHKVGVGALDQTLLLVKALLRSGIGVQEVDNQLHNRNTMSNEARKGQRGMDGRMTYRHLVSESLC